MPDDVRAVKSARRAYQNQNWPRVRDDFARVGADQLNADDLYALADSLWWLGETDDFRVTAEKAHKRFVEEGRPLEATRMAIDLGVTHFLRGDQVLGSAWMARAARLLEGQPESPPHGYLLYVTEVEANWRDVGSDEVLAAAREVRRIGLEHGDPTLVAVALNGEGRFRIDRGEVGEGLRLLDEAMAAVMVGDVTPDWMGNIYCNTIAACHVLGDIDRCRRWTDAAEQWLETLPAAALFNGICRVYRADLLRVSGEWTRAEDEATKVCRELIDMSVGYVGEGWYAIGEVRRLRGDRVGAEAAYKQAHEHGRDPQPGLALLRLTEGRIQAARQAITTALAAVTRSLERAPLLAAAVDIAVAADQLDEAREFSAELTRIAGEYHSSGLEAMAVTAEGTVALGQGEAAAALPLLREAFRRWRELRAPYEAARAAVSLGRVYRALGDEDAAGRELEFARSEFEHLGATTDRDLVAGVMGEKRSDGLSNREVEVLALVAQGHTNKEIGEKLFISPKTVARHLANVFAKLGVSSRTEAARYALERDLA